VKYLGYPHVQADMTIQSEQENIQLKSQMRKDRHQKGYIKM